VKDAHLRFFSITAYEISTGKILNHKLCLR